MKIDKLERLGLAVLALDAAIHQLVMALSPNSTQKDFETLEKCYKVRGRIDRQIASHYAYQARYAVDSRFKREIAALEDYIDGFHHDSDGSDRSALNNDLDSLERTKEQYASFRRVAFRVRSSK